MNSNNNMSLNKDDAKDKNTKSSHPECATKTVAIIIPCRNEEKFITRCLDSLLENEYPRELLYIVVGGMSTDGPREIVKRYSIP